MTASFLLSSPLSCHVSSLLFTSTPHNFSPLLLFYPLSFSVTDNFAVIFTSTVFSRLSSVHFRPISPFRFPLKPYTLFLSPRLRFRAHSFLLRSSLFCFIFTAITCLLLHFSILSCPLHSPASCWTCSS